MRILRKAVTVIGSVLCCGGFCLTAAGGFWYVPPLSVAIGMLLIWAGVNTLFKREPAYVNKKVPAYIFVSDDKGNETKLIAPITDFDLVYLRAKAAGKDKPEKEQ